MRRLKAWWLGTSKDPDWPIICDADWCYSAAYTAFERAHGRTSFFCDDCSEHIRAVMDGASFDRRMQGGQR